MENALMLILDTDIREMTQSLVDAGNDLAADNKIRGQIIGLERSKLLIHQYFEELSNASDEVDEQDE